MKRHDLARFALPLALSLAACADEKSDKLETNQIRISYYVEHEASEPGRLHLRAHPYRGGSLQGVDFTDGDRVEVTTNAMATPIVLERGPIGGYFGDLPSGDHREVTFALVRGEKASAPASKVKMMPPVVFESDPEGSTVSYASAGLALRWPAATPGARFVLDKAKPCDSPSASASTERGPEPPAWDDVGTLTITPAQLSAAPPPAGGACMYVTLRHVLSGTVDPALESGSAAEAIQDFSFEITLVP
jgi:hypothetical protein